MPILPFKQKHKLTNWREYDAIEGWRAAPRTTPGGQPWYSGIM